MVKIFQIEITMICYKDTRVIKAIGKVLLTPHRNFLRVVQMGATCVCKQGHFLLLIRSNEIGQLQSLRDFWSVFHGL